MSTDSSPDVKCFPCACSKACPSLAPMGRAGRPVWRTQIRNIVRWPPPCCTPFVRKCKWPCPRLGQRVPPAACGERTIYKASSKLYRLVNYMLSVRPGRAELSRELVKLEPRCGSRSAKVAARPHCAAAIPSDHSHPGAPDFAVAPPKFAAVACVGRILNLGLKRMPC